MTSYKEILDKITFSFSTLHQYEQCPYAFYNRKIDGTELNEGNFYSDAGGYMHNIQAQIFANQLSLDDALDYYIENYENNVCYTTKQSTICFGDEYEWNKKWNGKRISNWCDLEKYLL